MVAMASKSEAEQVDIGDDFFRAPDDVYVWWTERALAGRRLVHDPVFLHFDRVPSADEDTRLLFVGNHSLFALDAPVLVFELFKRKGQVIRPLGEKYLFTIPGVKQWIQRSGGVEGSRANCAALMQRGEPILVYPGGTREALHKRGMAHKLDWGDRAGFAQMAADHSYTIVPFACVGIDDQWRYWLDGRELAETALGRAVKRAGIVDRDELFPPVLMGLAGTPLPKPNRHYYAFGEPISTEKLDAKNPTDVWVLREDTRLAVQALLDELLAYRQQDPRGDYRVRFAEVFLNAVDKFKGK